MPAATCLPVATCLGRRHSKVGRACSAVSFCRAQAELAQYEQVEEIRSKSCLHQLASHHRLFGHHISHWMFGARASAAARVPLALPG